MNIRKQAREDLQKAGIGSKVRKEPGVRRSNVGREGIITRFDSDGDPIVKYDGDISENPEFADHITLVTAAKVISSNINNPTLASQPRAGYIYLFIADWLWPAQTGSNFSKDEEIRIIQATSTQVRFDLYTANRAAPQTSWVMALSRFIPLLGNTIVLSNTSSKVPGQSINNYPAIGSKWSYRAGEIIVTAHDLSMSGTYLSRVVQFKHISSGKLDSISIGAFSNGVMGLIERDLPARAGNISASKIQSNHNRSTCYKCGGLTQPVDTGFASSTMLYCSKCKL